MRIRDFSAINRDRCESPAGFNHKLNSWSLSDWFTATTGELGEAANIAKKLNRVRDGIPGNSETPEQLREALADEIADVFIYLDLLAQSEGIDLQDAVISKFNRTSAKRGYDVTVSSIPPVSDLPRAGDHILHEPSGETWVVAHATDTMLAWCGWPGGMTKLAECTIVKRCTDEEHLKIVREIAAMSDGDFRAAHARRYLASLALPAPPANDGADAC